MKIMSQLYLFIVTIYNILIYIEKYNNNYYILKVIRRLKMMGKCGLLLFIRVK